MKIIKSDIPNNYNSNNNSSNNHPLLVLKKVSELSHHPANANIYVLSDIESLKVSIKKVGLLEPLVVNKQNQVVSGNRRLKALQELKVKDVFVQVVDVPEPDVEYIILTHNKSRKKTFSEILNEIKVLRHHFKRGSGTSKGKNEKYNWRDLAAKEMGFSKTTLNNYLKVGEHPDLVKCINEGSATFGQVISHLDKQAKIQHAIEVREHEITEMETHEIKIYTQSSASLPQIETGSVQMSFSSPPYANQLRDYGVDGLGTEKHVDEYIHNLVAHYGETVRCVNDKGSIFVNIADCYINGSLQLIPQLFAKEMMKKYGLSLRNSITWTKTNSKPSNVRNICAVKTEIILHFTKHPSDYYYNPLMINSQYKCTKPSIPFHRTKPKEFNFNPIFPVDVKALPDYWDEETVQSAVANQHYTKKLGILHPAPFPESIVILPILMTTKPGDIVMDPFMGSGTTLRIAQKLKRRAVGIDLQPNFTSAVIKDFMGMAA